LKLEGLFNYYTKLEGLICNLLKKGTACLKSKGKQKHVVSGTFFFLIENIMNQCGRERFSAQVQCPLYHVVRKRDNNYYFLKNICNINILK
jgi:hypothetical protein